jgi:hypothetical protein
MADDTPSHPIPPQTTDPQKLKDTRERLLREAPQADGEMTRQHELGDEDPEFTSQPKPIAPPLRTD